MTYKKRRCYNVRNEYDSYHYPNGCNGTLMKLKAVPIVKYMYKCINCGEEYKKTINRGGI